MTMFVTVTYYIMYGKIFLMFSTSLPQTLNWEPTNLLGFLVN